MKNLVSFCLGNGGHDRNDARGLLARGLFARGVRLAVLAWMLAAGAVLVSCGKEEDPSDNSQNGSDTPEVLVSGDRFSVSDVLQVRFAPGNLKKGGHGFVQHQYEHGGLFGWGTGNRPTITTIEFEDYTTFYDWGTYSGDGAWRTMTWKEWQYLLRKREGAITKFGTGTVYGVRGLILLPDQWAQPPDLKFISGYGWWKNTYDLEQWAEMEDSGAVFLPTAGIRWEEVTSREGMSGFYWCAPEPFDYDFGDMGYCMAFGETDADITFMPRPTGCSVRLVRED